MSCPNCNLLTAPFKLARAALGIKLVSIEVEATRQRACKGDEAHPPCPHYRGAGWFGATCEICRCVISAKVKLPAETCPADPPRWKAL